MAKKVKFVLLKNIYKFVDNKDTTIKFKKKIYNETEIQQINND